MKKHSRIVHPSGQGMPEGWTTNGVLLDALRGSNKTPLITRSVHGSPYAYR